MVDKMKTFAERLKYLRKKRGHSLAAIGKAMSVSAQAVHKWESGGNLDVARQTELAAVLNISPSWLLFGEGGEERYVGEPLEAPMPQPPASIGPGAVPIMDIRFIEQWLMGNGQNAPSDTEWILCPCEHSPRTYALRITDDSMEDLGSRISYSVGDVVFLDAGRNIGKDGGRVAIYDPGADNAMKVQIRQISKHDGGIYVWAFNPKLKHLIRELSEYDRISGVVIGKWVAE